MIYGGGLSPPKFISKGDVFKVVLGDSVILPCQVQDLGKFLIFLLLLIYSLSYLETVNLKKWK